MEVLERPGAVDPAESPAVRRRLRWGVLLVVAPILVVAALAARTWWPRDVFGPWDDQVSLPLEVGEVGLVGVFPEPDHQVQLIRVEPVVAAGSAPAAISFLMCDGQGGLGSASGPNVVPSNCRDGVSSISDHPMLLPTGDASDRPPQLVAVIVPLAPGRVVVQGVRLTYRDDGRTRTEHTGVGFEIVASPAQAG